MAISQSNELEQVETASSMLFWMTLSLIVGAGGTFYYLNDTIAAIAMIPLAAGACMGYRSGAWKMLSMLAGSVCGYYFAAPTATRLVPLIESTSGLTLPHPSIGVGLSGFVAGSVATIFLLAFGWLAMSRSPRLRSLDQNFGLLIGVTQSIAIVAIGLWTVLAMEPRMIELRGSQRLDPQASQATLYHRFLAVADETRKSPLLSQLVDWNPIASHPMLIDFLNKSQSMVLDLQTKISAARSGSIPPGSKLTGMLSELQSQGSITNASGSQNPGSASSLDISGMLQKLINSQQP